MYAMLTGNLPFTVEPFNIKSLYNKMMKNDMNPIPEHLSKSKFYSVSFFLLKIQFSFCVVGEDLLKKLLNSDPYKRITLKEAMDHDWVNEGYKTFLKPFPYPNKPTEDQLNPTILRYMTNNMQFHTTEVTENIKLNKASSSLSTYYLLLNKIKTMIVKMEPKKVEFIIFLQVSKKKNEIFCLISKGKNQKSFRYKINK
jgi:Neu-associated kinase